MQQIRFDFLGGVNGSNGRNSNANANSPPTGDAFAQILDQQLTRRAEPGADGRRPQVLKRRDAKSAAPAPASNKLEATEKPSQKVKQPEKPTAENDPCTRGAAKPQPDEGDETAEAAPGAQTTSESNGSSSASDAESNADTPSDSDQQQQNEAAQQQAGDGGDQNETEAASADLSLLAILAVPLPLQPVTADADVSADATALAGGGNAVVVLQADLAAKLVGSIDLGAAVTAKPGAPTNAGGLKFGAILNADLGGLQKAGANALAALQDATDALAGATDPLVQPAPDANSKARDSGPNTTKSKAHETTASDKAAATVNPELNAKATASIVQPMARPLPVTWSGTTNIRNELAESMSVQAGAGFATDEAEFTNWAQVLGSGATVGGSLSARQTAFMTQLRQNLQNLPAHEQIAVQIKNAMQNGNSRLTVALHPAELGRVEVKLDIDKDKNVTATIVVERPATLDMLRNDAKALERALQDAGLQTGSGSLSFSLRDSDGQNGSPNQNGTGTGGSGSGTGAAGSEAKAEVRTDVVATADGYVDLET